MSTHGFRTVLAGISYCYRSIALGPWHFPSLLLQKFNRFSRAIIVFILVYGCSRRRTQVAAIMSSEWSSDGLPLLIRGWWSRMTCFLCGPRKAYVQYYTYLSWFQYNTPPPTNQITLKIVYLKLNRSRHNIAIRILLTYFAICVFE